MIASSMAAAASSSSLWTCSSSPLRKDTSTTLCALSSACVNFHAKSQNFYSFRWNPQPGLSLFSSWNGLRRNLGVSIPKQYAKIERKGKCKRNEGVYASLFGVGAPEALVIGVVALLVFGPKGLAEVARNLGKTLRAFQPTIRELQDVSREFKSTLEREIGLDDFQDPNQQQQKKTIYTSSSNPITSSSSSNPITSSDPNGAQAYSSEEYLKITEEQLKSLSSSSQQQLTDNIPTTLEPDQSDPQTGPAQEADVPSPPPSQKHENEA